MLATYAASRHRQIVPCCMISSVSHDNVSRLVTDRSMCFATALDKAFENIDCMSAILRCQAKNRFYESIQRLIQPRRVLCNPAPSRTRDKVSRMHRTPFQAFDSFRCRSQSAIAADPRRGASNMSLWTIILIILVIALLGGFSGIGGGPFYGTGYYGGGGLGLVIVILLILLLLGKL